MIPQDSTSMKQLVETIVYYAVRIIEHPGNCVYL